MTLTIRPIRPSDHADWRRLWTAYLEFYETTVAEETFQTTFSRLISNDFPKQNGCLAELNGRAVGLVHYITHPHNWRQEEVVYLQDLYADPTVRGRGVGRALIQEVYDIADKNGTPTVYWLTQEFNKPARLLYDRIAHVTPFIKYQR